jgi:anti-sigma-K factor RskA
MKDRSELEELISAYALGALEGEELKQVEDLLASGSEEAKLLLREYQEVTINLSYASKGLKPEPELRKKVLSEILGSRGLPVADPPPPFWSRFWNIGLSLGGAVAVGAILLLFISNHSLNQKLQMENTRTAELESKVSDQEQLISSLKTKIAQKESEMGIYKDSYAHLDELTEFLEDPDVYVIHLSNMHDNAEAGSGVLVDKDDDEALFYCLDLNDAPEHKTYQLWVKADGVNKSIAVFKVDGKGTHLVKLKPFSHLGHLEGYSVTLEPDGGVEKPSGQLIFAGDHRGSSL